MANKFTGYTQDDLLKILDGTKSGSPNMGMGIHGVSNTIETVKATAREEFDALEKRVAELEKIVHKRSWGEKKQKGGF